MSCNFDGIFTLLRLEGLHFLLSLIEWKKVQCCTLGGSRFSSVDEILKFDQIVTKIKAIA